MPGSHSKNITLNDIARLAGVSYATVSRVINHNPNVAESTRQRVLKWVEEYNYIPSQAARSLHRTRTNWLQVIVGNYFSLNFNDLYSIALNAGYRLGITVVRDWQFKESFRKGAAEASSGMLDGILVIEPELEFQYDELASLFRGKPFVQVGSNPGAEVPSVIFNQRAGTSMAIQHLIDLGHRKIVEIKGMQNLFDGRARHQAYLEAMHANQLPPGLSLDGEFSTAGGYEKGHELVTRGIDFTAVFCANDLIAAGLIHALDERGVRVPGDVSVVGFDDQRGVEHMIPPLTTIRQDPCLSYSQAFQYLIDLMANPDLPRQRHVLMPNLVVRNSTRSIL